ncbi:guanine nucleotide-binding protein-like 3 homolog isoform X2 [Morus notabilis]|uniref:guanine nucleotide-binding protein-like 3 homolog isoform X2 n=1 Tax=Morus notabilis TaxID=981085 RepID=UPI000CED5249|nr:guanine nucleotide-binding protein-like 3 homolog isoform X2 [Morus notabilis]
MTAVAPAAASHLLHHILHYRPPPPLSSSPFLKKPLLISSVSPSNNTPKRTNLLTHSHQFRCLLFCHTLSLSKSLIPPINASLSVENEAELEEEEEEEEEAEDEDEYDDDDDSEAREVKMIEDFDEEEENGGEKESEKMDNVGLHSLRVKTTGMQLPSLTVKEKKELASYAHSLGKKLKSQLVGKSGVTSNVATSFVETLESNELLKIKIHRTCPGELDDVVKQLEELTGSVVVGKIGRTVIIYRPSLTKLKAEEKKQQFQKILMRRKQLRARPAFPTKGARPRLSGRGRRGSSRV